MEKFSKHRLWLSIFSLLFSSHFNSFAGSTRVHITTDKENYSAAETIQFQVFLLNPSEKINNSLFIELLDCYGNKLTRQMLPISFNAASGHIQLPEAGKNEFYLLYCYVKNSDSIESSSIKKIFMGNAGIQKKSGGKIKISHFFEGGSFIAESPNNILVHCVDEFSNPVIAKGKVTDGKTGIYAVFETNELGFAKIIMNPEDKVRYFIEVKDKDNREDISPVPIAASSGITLNTTITPTSIVYNLISYSAMDAPLPDYKIEAVYNGEIVYDAAVSFQNGLSAIKEELKKESLPPGFITFRVVDRSNKIYARRILYNSILPAENNFIRVIDSINKKEAKIILPPEMSGKSYISIKTPGPGAAGNHNQNFLTVSEKISINDQLIAMTDLPQGFKTTDENINRYLSLKGTLSNYEKKPLVNKKVNLVIMQKNFKKQYLVTKTDGDGKLQVDNLLFYDSVTVYYQLSDKSDQKNDVLLDLKVSPTAELQHETTASLDLICAGNITVVDSSRTMVKTEEKTLKQVIVSTDKPKTDSEKYADKYVSGQMKRTHFQRNEIDLIANPETIDNRSLFTYIQGRIPSVRIFFNAVGAPVLTALNGGTVGVYLNDMELPLGESLGFLSDLMIKDVASIKYSSMSHKPKLIGGNPLTDAKAADGGDLLIYTKRDFIAEEKTKGLPKTTVVGYDLVKPVFASQLINNNESLFWKPDWKVESGQRIFINLPPGADNNIEITIEGINSFLMPYHFTQKLVFN